MNRSRRSIVNPWHSENREDGSASLEPRVVIEMGGPNVVIRATARVDRAYTTSLAAVLNAAAATDTCVVIDPEPIRCDDEFAAHRSDDVSRSCSAHRLCRPVPAEVAAEGVVRLRAERATWLIDVGRGRFCRTDPDRDLSVRFLADDSWSLVVAVCVTPTRLIALGVDGGLVSAERAHMATAV
jgi:hypothetical protein